jgi:Tfp pilus assembly protein PilF
VDSEERKLRAADLFRQAYRAQMNNRLEEAARLYKASLACFPTAEAHTFLGWTYSVQNRVEDAIEECKRAVAVDPTLGNPYNDIGSYLIRLGRMDEAIPWLQKAITAERYEARHYPHCNLGRVYRSKGQLKRAIEELEKALAIEPQYPYALEAIASVRQQLN